MTLSEAQELIATSKLARHTQQWADLGCGSGLFTHALATLLPAGSSVVGIDSEKQKLSQTLDNGSQIIFLQADFEKDDLPFQDLDGILMANSLHYIPNKNSLISRLQNLMKADVGFIIVEYDTENSNPWVPHPISFSKLKQLFKSLGYHQVEKIGERDSVYNANKMYAALILT